MNAVRLGDVLDPEKNLREWARRGGESPQKGSPAAAMQWAVAELDSARTCVAELKAVADDAIRSIECGDAEMGEHYRARYLAALDAVPAAGSGEAAS